MESGQDLNAQLARHRELSRKLSHAWNPFFASFAALRPIQLEAIPAVLTGRNILLTAPTAGGKTEAVMAPVAERLRSSGWPGLSVLLITPTRALVNDMYQRLERPLSDMKIALGRKTSDHAISVDIREQVLITTPESIESLLSLRKEALQNVQVVILDEIHLLDGTPRGDQLRSLLQRLRAYRLHVAQGEYSGVQLIALSATVADPTRLANAYLGDSPLLVQVAGQRELESEVILAQGDEKSRAESAIEALGDFHDARKILVFVNSRKQVDQGVAHFRHGKYAKVPILGHHGSLSKDEREKTEARFRQEPVAICVATMTLEVGIDIGDVDLVVCVDPPFSLSSFLQRIGRGCRRLAGKTRVLCVARDRAGELMFNALIQQASSSMPRVPVPPFRRSVLVQQILAYLKQVPRNLRTAEQFVSVFQNSGFPQVGSETINAVLDDMAREEVLDKRCNVYQPASRGWEFIQSNKLFTNIQPNPLEISLVDVDTGKVVARVKSIVPAAKGVTVAGTSYELVQGGGSLVQRVRGSEGHEETPKYNARKLPYAADVGTSLSNYFKFGTHELAVISIGNTILVMTWLGKLCNAALAAELARQGYKGGSGSFHIVVDGVTSVTILDLVRVAVARLKEFNPLGKLDVEKMVDVGPHWQYLSPGMQVRGKEDWLDLEYLQDWACRLTAVREIPADSSLRDDLLALIGGVGPC